MTVLTDTSHHVEFSLEELIIGRELSHPVYDQNGVLLLAEGNQVTAKLKESLIARGTGLLVHEDDVDSLRISLPTQPTGLTFSSDTSEKLDSMLDKGLLTVHDSGNAIKDQFEKKSGKYDPYAQEEMKEMHERSSAALGEMMMDALHGSNTDGGLAAIMVADYLKQMTTDSDGVLASAIDSLQGDTLLDRSMEPPCCRWLWQQN